MHPRLDLILEVYQTFPIGYYFDFGYEKNVFKNIGILHECGDGIEKSIPRITDWLHEACRMVANGDHEGRIFLSHPPTNNGFFFLLTTKDTKYLILHWKNMKKSSRKS